MANGIPGVIVVCCGKHRRPITGVIMGARAVGVKSTGVVKGIDFVSQHSNHRSDHIQPTRVPVVDAILLWDWPSKATIVCMEDC